MPIDQPTSTELPARIGSEYEPIGELSYECLLYVAELCALWCAEQLHQYADAWSPGANDVLM